MHVLACHRQIVSNIELVNLVREPLTQGLEDIIGRAQEDVVQGLDGEDLAHPLVEDTRMEDDRRLVAVVVTGK